MALHQRSERGAVTAELAMGLPLLVAVTIGLVWLLSVGAAQVRTVDAARETARAVARGDDTGRRSPAVSGSRPRVPGSRSPRRTGRWWRRRPAR